MDKPEKKEEHSYDKAWKAELQKRLEEAQSGKANFVSSKSVIAEIRKKIATSGSQVEESL